MANAIAQLIEIIPLAAGPRLRLAVSFAGQGVNTPGQVDASEVVVDLGAGDTANTVRQKMSTAVTTEATRLGYPLVSSDVLLPTFQKG